MKITKRQLRRIIREEYSRLKRRELIKEGRMKEAMSKLQNDILELAQNQGGEIAVNEATSKFGSRLEMDNEAMYHLMMDMMDQGILEQSYDFELQQRMGPEMVAFNVHPDYM